MNIVVIANNKRSSKMIKESIETAFKDDNIRILSYDTTDDFITQMSVRNLSVDRILLLEKGIEGVSEDSLFEFVAYINKYHPATRVVTISQGKEMSEYFYHVMSVEYSIHMAIKKITMQTILNFAIATLDDIREKYPENLYVPLSSAHSVTIEMEDNKGEGAAKQGFLGKIFGRKPKNAIQEKRNGPQQIGMSRVGYDPLAENPEEIDDFEPSIQEGIDYGMFEGEYARTEGETDYDESEDLEEKLERELSKYQKVDLDKEGHEETEEEDIDWKNEVEDVEDVEDSMDLDVDIGDIDWGTSENEESTEGDTGTEGLEEEGIGTKDEIEIDIDLEKMMGEYKDSNKEIIEVEKIVERVVEVEKIVERIVEVNQGGSLSGARNRNGIRVILVTGDRGTGVTKAALNLATLSALEEKTLYADFDIFRKGSLSYLGIEDMIHESEQVQNGVKYLKKAEMLPNLVGVYNKGKFFTLTSMYGVTVTDEELFESQRVLATQREYTTVVVDCPIENLYLMTHLLSTNNIIMCVPDTKVSVVNAVISLMDSTGDATLKSMICEKTRYYITGKGRASVFKNNLEYVNNLFSLDKTEYDWSSVDILGTKTEIKEILGRL